MKCVEFWQLDNVRVFFNPLLLCLYRNVNDYCTTDVNGFVIEVKWENYPDVKLEDAHGSNMDCQDIFVKVRLFAVCISIFSKYAAYHNVLT